MVTADGGKRVIAGNARVLRARLSDGEFYWEQDRKKSLHDWADGLKDVVFHAKVGMMNEKVARIETLAALIAKAVGFEDATLVQQAARLCKADLTSGMVGEFPELQGIMGRYYAIAQGESPAVADAIRDHYLPKGASKEEDDALNGQSVLTAIVAIADKFDSIASLFKAGEKPTGSKDPFALRRQALGIVRIILENKLPVNIVELIDVAGGNYSVYKDAK
jgi:glycyl-tRNA synthetase beta chain